MNKSRKSAEQLPRGRLVEIVRLIFITLLGTSGFTVATQVGGSVTTSKTLLGVFLGALTGYVVGGVFGRLTATAVMGLEETFGRRSAAETVMGAAGLLIGLAISFLITLPLLITLPPLAAWPAAVFIYLALGSVGYGIARAKQEEIYALLGLKPRAAVIGKGDVSVIDTSVLIDGRVVDLAQTGFLGGTLLVHSGVLHELQRIADSSDDNRRARGRRGLDALTNLQRDPRVEVQLVEEEGVTDVDAALVRLSKDRGGTLVTADTNLAKVAEAVSVPVRSINALAAAFRQPLTPGEQLALHLVKEGREHGQGVGYLDDGTMVVVQDAVRFIGSDVTVKVTNTLQTPSGRMVFATLAESGAP